jgi:hypothetical protein
MHDIVKRLRKYADEYAPVPVEDLRAAADEIERLRRLDGAMPPGYVLERLDDGMWWWGETAECLDGTSYAERNRCIAAAWAHHASAIRPPTSFDELERRVAMLESSARRTGYRIDAAAAAMKDVASRESLHPSVRYVADNLRIAFVGRPADEVEVDDHG